MMKVRSPSCRYLHHTHDEVIFRRKYDKDAFIVSIMKTLGKYEITRPMSVIESAAIRLTKDVSLHRKVDGWVGQCPSCG